MSCVRPSKQLGQRPPPVGTLEAVVVLDPHHRHALPGGGELVHRSGDGLFALGYGSESPVPLGLADDRRTREGHCSMLRSALPRSLRWVPQCFEGLEQKRA
jgi:hypothetical protein